MESGAQACPGERMGQDQGIWNYVKVLTHSTRGKGAEPVEMGC